ncbi:MAG: flagellar hook-basal body complex protein, partial [Arthrobacter sp.]
AGLNTAKITGQNGNEAGTLDSFSIGSDGTVVGAFSNGLKQAVGRIAMANFTNPAGLEKAGASGYRTSVNSGVAMIGTANAAGLGGISGGYLEMSNVDLSQEFTNLIVAQRGFQANARIITTSDEVLQELTNLKR